MLAAFTSEVRPVRKNVDAFREWEQFGGVSGRSARRECRMVKHPTGLTDDSGRQRFNPRNGGNNCGVTHTDARGPSERLHLEVSHCTRSFGIRAPITNGR